MYVNDISDEVSAASRKKKSGDSDWVQIRLGDEKQAERVDMEDRLKDAKRWVSKQLTDDEAAVLNRAMGIENDLAEIDAETPKKQRPLKGKTSREQILADPLLLENSRIKGFLDINPYVCSGCGSTFQSKEPETPGFLPKEKLQDHRGNAIKIREKQDAIRILELAGIALDSDTAEEVLREAKISMDVIQSVRAIGATARTQVDAGREQDEAVHGEDSDFDLAPVSTVTSKNENLDEGLMTINIFYF
jgi:hypothetical protein